MLHKGRLLIVALGLICASVASTQAVDLCFSTSGGGGITVGKEFEFPPVNQCRPFNGFEVGAGTDGATTGTVCTAVTGGQLLYHYSFHNWFALGGGSYFESGTCRFTLSRGPSTASLPASGNCRGTVIPASGDPSGFVLSANMFSCNENVPEDVGP